MWLDARNGPLGDLPTYDGTPRTWIVASTPRTGSTLLCRAVWGTGLAGAPAEYLNPMQIRDWEVRFGSIASRVRHRPLRGPLLGLVGRARWSDERLREHLDRVRTRRTGPTGWFGLKIHHHHFKAWFLDAGRDPADFFGPITWVRLTREDRLGQGLSWARALQTGRWAAHQRAWRRPSYDRSAIAKCLARIEADEAGWDAYFRGRGVAPLALTFEEVTRDLAGSARRVLAGLGVPGADLATVPSPDLEPQADATTARWRVRFTATG